MLALATGWLAWRTHSMASATREVAAQTKLLAEATVEMAKQTERATQATEQMLTIEATRFEGEQTANLIPVRWDGTNGLVVKNIGRAPAILRQAVVAKPWRYKDNLSIPVSPGETKSLGPFDWLALGMSLTNQPNVTDAPPGKTWARVKWDDGESGWTLIDDSQ